jgi:hypothetical protein
LDLGAAKLPLSKQSTAKGSQMQARLKKFTATLGFMALVCAGIATLTGLTSATANGATSVACQGGDFRVILPSGRVLSSYSGWKILPSELPSHSRVLIRGRYIDFEVDVSNLAVYDYTLTGASNPLDMTNGARTPIFEYKLPDLKGLTLDDGQLEIRLSPQSGVIRRRGSAVGMKLQFKDCAQGGIFQMEPDQQTVITHKLAPGIFYFTNPFTGKINFGDGAEVRGKDSPQVATKLAQYGDGSVWQVEPGGRMGAVFGEDAVELSAGATPCVHQCQARDRVRGSLPVPGFR